MTNKQGAPEAPRGTAADGKTELFNVTGYPLMVRAVDFNRLHAENERLAALVAVLQPTAHVQNPAEIEHVGGDVSKNGAESNMAQQPAPSAAAQIDSALNDYAQAFVARVNGWTKQNGDDLPVARAVLFQAITDYARELAMAASQPSPTPQADSQPAAVRDERDDFEKVFPLPSGCIRVGIGYASTGYSNWAAHTHVERWQGWQARAARAPADSVTAPAATPTAASIAWTALRDLTDPLGEAGVKIMGHVRIYAQRQYEAGLTEGRATPPTQAQAGAADDAELIRRMLEKLELFDDAGPLGEGWQSNELEELLAAARARLEKAP